MTEPQEQPTERRAQDDFVGVIKHHERRQTWHADSDCAKLVEVDKRFRDGDDRMERIEKKLDANTLKTDEVLDILNLAKSFFRILGLIGTIAKWLTVVAAPVVAVYYTIKGK